MSEPTSAAGQARPVRLMTPTLGAEVPPPGRGGLGRWSRRIVAALAESTIPPGHRVEKASAPIATAKLDQVLAELPWLIRWSLVLGLFAIELSAIFFTGSRFSKLDSARRLRVLDRWHHGNATARVVLRGLLTPIKIAYYADEEVSASLGYQPPDHEPKPGALDALPSGDVRIGRHREEEEVRCEVVVIGSGAGGAVVAKELAERGRDVVLIEEGQYWTRSQFNRRPFEMQRRMYRDLSFTVALGKGGGIPIPLGRTVGGTTTINSGTCFRVPEHTLSLWREKHGLTQFTEDLLAPHYERVEQIIRVQPVPERVLGNTARMVQRGAAAMGLHAHPLRRNADDCHGSGVCCFGCPQDAKRSMNVSYVPAALEHGAKLYTETRAMKLLHENGRAAGVVCEMGPERRRLVVKADAVVVSAGTIYTPFFLQGQGLGKRSGQLGRNLSIHPATKVAGLFDEEMRPWDGVPQGLYIHDLAEEGVLFEGASMTPEFSSVGLPFYGPKLVQTMERYRNLAMFGIMVEDDGRGKVRRGLDGRPLMIYRAGSAELARLRKGIETLSRLFFRAGARVVFPPIASLPELHSEEECARIAEMPLVPEDLELTAFHPLGTCRMALDDRRGVIDPGCESWEMDRLFVVDGSIFPSSLGVNPQLTIMAFATRAAGHIDDRLSGKRRAGPVPA